MRWRSSPNSTRSSRAGRRTTGARSPAEYSRRWTTICGSCSTSGPRGATMISRKAGSSAGISANAISSGTTTGYSAPPAPAPTSLSSPGPTSSGTSWSRAGRHLTTRNWPDTGRNGGGRSNPRWTATPCGCSPSRTRCARFAETRCRPLNNRPNRPASGNDGGCISPARRSPQTTSLTTDGPAHRRTTTTPAWYTPPAGAGTAPATREPAQPGPARPSGSLEPYAAISGSCGSEGAGAQQCVPATRPNPRFGYCQVLPGGLSRQPAEERHGTDPRPGRGPRDRRLGRPPASRHVSQATTSRGTCPPTRCNRGHLTARLLHRLLQDRDTEEVFQPEGL